MTTSRLVVRAKDDHLAKRVQANRKASVQTVSVQVAVDLSADPSALAALQEKDDQAAEAERRLIQAVWNVW
jgi:hypothetical protein